MQLWTVLLVGGGVVFALAEGLIVWSVLRCRRRDNQLPRQVHGNNRLETIWTVIPLLIVTGLFVLSWRGIQTVNAQSASPDRIIRVEAFQWQWNFTYAGERLPAAAGQQSESLRLHGTIPNPPVLVLPLGETVRFELQSRDVIHSFFVPGFRFKRDAIPGQANSFEVTVDRLGTFSGQCAEYCGLLHNKMVFTIKVVPPEEFHDWLAQAKQQAADEQQAAAG